MFLIQQRLSKKFYVIIAVFQSIKKDLIYEQIPRKRYSTTYKNSLKLTDSNKLSQLILSKLFEKHFSPKS